MAYNPIGGVRKADVEPRRHRESATTPDTMETGTRYPFSDREIAAGVKYNLIHDDRVDSDQVDFVVSEGVVSLEGTVDSAEERQAAENAAWKVAGVLRVINLLAVKKQ